MDIEWKRAKRLPTQGSYIYVEQVSPARAFIGQVVLIWLNENDREVIAVADSSGDVVNLAENDRWVEYNSHHRHTQDIEILRRYNSCPCCDAPILESKAGNIDHAWLWS
jgi:hypothetical protein